VEVGKGSFRDKLRLVGQLRKNGVDIFIVSSQDQGRVPRAIFSGAKVIVAFDKVKRYKGEAKEKLRPLISISVKYEPDLSDAENNLRLIQALGDDVRDPGTRFDWIEEGEKEAINRELDSVISGHNGPLVVLSPGTNRPSRAWPPQNFTEVAVKLNTMYGAKL